MDEAQIENAIEFLAQRYGMHPSFVAAVWDYERGLILKLDESQTLRRADFPESLDLGAFGMGAIELHVETSAPLRPMVGNIIKNPPLPAVAEQREKDKSISLDSIAGGDACGNESRPGYYGTVTLCANETGYDVKSGPCRGQRCTVQQAIIGNNHVIARNDQGSPGEHIWAAGSQRIDRFAVLHCYPSFRCVIQMDIAFGRINDSATMAPLTVRGIGQISGIRKPNGNEHIRKFGARTGYTEGSITGRATIRVEGRMIPGTYVTTRGFGCAGDSGSPVVGRDGALLGIYSWGEAVPCENNPLGYFFSIVDSGRMMMDSGLLKTLIR